MTPTDPATRLTWLGHATWLLQSPGGRRVLVDAWIDGNPSCPDAFKEGGVDPVDLILVTHGHGDHIGDLVATAGRTGAQVVGIHELCVWLGAQGVENVSGMNKGGTQETMGLKVTMTHAVHSSSHTEGDTIVYLGEAAGYVIEMEDGLRVYAAGDTAVFSDMALIGELYRPHLAILPVGDHYTMGPREAAVAARLLGVRKILCEHVGTFPVLTGTPEALRGLVDAQVEVIGFEPGETLSEPAPTKGSAS